MNTPSKKVSILALISVIFVTAIILASIKLVQEDDVTVRQQSLVVGMELDGRDSTENWNALLEEFKRYEIDQLDEYDEILESLKNQVYVGDDSLTTDIAVELASSFFKIMSEGRDLDQATQDRLVQNVVTNAVDNKKIIENYYTATDIKTFNPETEREKLLTFMQGMHDIISTEVTKASNINAQTEITEYFEINSRLFTNISRRLATLETPSNLISHHLELINTYHNMGKLLSNLTVGGDPILEMISLRIYTELSDQIPVISGSMDEYFNNSGIIYLNGKFVFEN